jgi:sigma-B regulation protein RsbU (phosphoserine phosphatase)
MNILVAEDDAVTRQLLVALLAAAGHKPTAVENGRDAWDAWLLARPRVVISDWQMPELDGLELCRRLRARPREQYTYFVLLTARSGKESYLTAMEAGIDDFITKPVDPDELKARLTVAERILGLRQELHALEGLLPICAYCKRIRNDQNQWSSLEGYIERRSKAEFSHGICPDCYAKHVESQLGRRDGAV